MLVVTKDAINSASMNLMEGLQTAVSPVGKRVILPTVSAEVLRTAVMTAFAIIAQQPVIGPEDRVKREPGESLIFVDQPLT